jgi:hypothetical protein
MSYELFHKECISGNLTNAQQIFSQDKLNIQPSTFIDTLENGHLYVIEWLLTIPDIIEESFITACYRGNLYVAKWIFDRVQLKQSDINAGFDSACESKYKIANLELIKWLAPYYTYDHCHGLITACANNHLDIVAWIVNNMEISESVANKALEIACIYSSLEFVKLLWPLCPDNNTAFINACNNDNEEIAK